MSKSGPEDQPVERTLFLELVDGVLVPPKSFRREVVRDALKYEARPGDIFLATYPKTGATWTQYTLWCLLSLKHGKGEEENAHEVPSFADIMTKCAPFLELVGRKVVEDLAEPRIIKHHLTFTASPYHPDAKYVVIVRNPFDSAVSFYHHCMGDRINLGMRADTTFDEFFEDYMDGHVPFGHYFEHILSWYAHRNDPNVFFFYYENFKRDPERTVLALAKFVDQTVWAMLRADRRLLDQVLQRISFSNLKSSVSIVGDVHHVMHDSKPNAAENCKNAPGHQGAGGADDTSNDSGCGNANSDVTRDSTADGKDSGESLVSLSNFFRKGQVGDWRNLFKPEQERRLRDMYGRRMRGTEMWDVWKEYLY
ncbi:sulfotransferase 1C2-like [Amblyomma americanum]